MPFVVDLMENEVFRERYERGLAEGESKGKAERFGELSTWAQERLERSSVDQLETWSVKLLDAASLDQAMGRT